MIMAALNDEVLLARQAIFDSNLNVHAYELLFRSNLVNTSGVTSDNADLATSQVINHTFIDIGVEHVMGNKLGFINLTRAFLTGELPLPFTSGNIVLEILEDIEIDDEIIAAVENLSKQGYTIALDDFIFHEKLRPLVKLADIIKIDLLALSRKELIEHVEILKQENVKLLAEKVETFEEFELCQQLGFEYFQGYFFCKPTLLNARPLPENKTSALRILSSLQQPDVTIDEVETLVAQDPGISIKLLRCLNSAAMGLPRQIDSIRQAVVMLGLKTIKSWATIIAFSTMDCSTDAIITTSLVRAKLAELLAADFNMPTETAFLTGLLSTLEAMLQKPMPVILDNLPLDDNVKTALIDHSGSLGELLVFIIDFEKNTSLSNTKNIDAKTLNTHYLNALEWVTNTESSF